MVTEIRRKLLPQLKESFPSVMTELGGDIEEQQAQQNERIVFLAAMIMVYILLLYHLKVMGNHLLSCRLSRLVLQAQSSSLMLADLSMMSNFGLIAAAGLLSMTSSHSL